MKTSCRAFTLLELLVVIAMIAALAGGVAMMGRGGGRAVALRTAQATLAASLAAARGQAALRGTNAGLLVQVDATVPAWSYRRAVVAWENPADGTWQPVDAWVEFPAGVALLPTAIPSGDAIEPGADWSGLRSYALGTTVVRCDEVDCLVVRFTPRGTVVGLGGDLVLAPATLQPPGSAAPLRYEQPDAVRGLALSSYGLVTPIESRSGF